MAKFRIQSHGRLQEWVAEEKGLFKKHGIDAEVIIIGGGASRVVRRANVGADRHRRGRVGVQRDCA